MICLSTQNGTARPPTLTVKIREILEQITGYVAGTHHSLTSGDIIMDKNNNNNNNNCKYSFLEFLSVLESRHQRSQVPIDWSHHQ